ncbi:MAG: YpdA family putative bacillithiol disulfide reductase [Gemmatimonadetes bacterium]|nr:YpdA family putative bacillithiol disulfide reductase [Gemmatimonadota bacterium]
MTESFDISVVGAGPCGLSVGVAARQAGIGCVHLDRGCIANCIAGYPTYATFFSTPERLELGGLPFIVASDKPTRREALKYYRRVAQHFELDVRQYEDVLEVTRQDGGFALLTRRHDGWEGECRARKVVIATGNFDTPNSLGAPGEELPKVTHYYREGHPFFAQDCVVVGAGNSAVEAALDLYRSGARVTLVHFLDRLDPGVKPWILPDITNRIEKGEITVRWRTRVAEIAPGCVILRHEDTGALERLANAWVFAMTGYSPDHRMLHALGVTIDPETWVPCHDPETMETDVPGVFVAGVLVNGRGPTRVFIENGREHGERIIRAVVAELLVR